MEKSSAGGEAGGDFCDISLHEIVVWCLSWAGFDGVVLADPGEQIGSGSAEFGVGSEEGEFVAHEAAEFVDDGGGGGNGV